MALTITATAAQAPLQVSTQSLPDDVRVTIHVQPTAALGAVDVAVGLGQGSKGKGARIGDDPAVHVALVRRLVAHLSQYARDFEQAAASEEPAWHARLCAASALLDPAPTITEHAPLLPALVPCVHCAQLSPWTACADCEPF